MGRSRSSSTLFGGPGRGIYKRPVPKALQAEGRPKQIWRSLNTDNEAAAKAAYRTVDAETDALLAEWRQGDSQPVAAGQPQSPVKGVSNYTPLTPALLRQLSDAHYLNVYEDDFQWRGDLWKAVASPMRAGSL